MQQCPSCASPFPHGEPLSPEALADQRGTYDRIACALPGGAVAPRCHAVAPRRCGGRSAQPAVFSSAISERRAVPNAMDPPEHTSWRVLVDGFFTPKQVAAQEPRVRAVADAVVAALPRGAPWMQ